jgi:poly(ADP-ribose) glycohydrolase
MVAIDATDFTKQIAQNYQYSKKGIRREICKAYAGFSGAGLEADEDIPIVSGRWGCGAFGGDEDLKILEQWVAAS